MRTVLYVPDERTTGVRPADVERLPARLDGLVGAGNTVVAVEHDLRVAAASDRVIDVGPGPGGGRIVTAARPAEVAKAPQSRTVPYLAAYRGESLSHGDVTACRERVGRESGRPGAGKDAGVALICAAVERFDQTRVGEAPVWLWEGGRLPAGRCCH